jgi:hypothetical protein
MISNMLGRTKYFRAPAVLCPSATGCRHLETALAFTPHELLVAFRTVHKCMLTPVKKKNPPQQHSRVRVQHFRAPAGTAQVDGFCHEVHQTTFGHLTAADRRLNRVSSHSTAAVISQLTPAARAVKSSNCQSTCRSRSDDDSTRRQHFHQTLIPSRMLSDDVAKVAQAGTRIGFDRINILMT